MKKLLNFRLPLFLAASFATGVAVYYFVLVGLSFLAIFFSVAFAAALIAFLIVRRKETLKTASFVFVFVVFATAGFFDFKLQVNSFYNAFLGNHYHTVEGVVKNVTVTTNGYKLILTDLNVSGYGKLNYDAAVYVTGSFDAEQGDRIAYRDLLRDKTHYYDGRFSASDVAEKIKYVSNVRANDLEIKGSIPNIFQKTNLWIKNSLSGGLNGDEFAVSYALVSGNSEYMDDDVISSFRAAGVAHIFAVSGLHVGFFATILALMLKKIPLNRYFKTAIIVFGLFFYAGVCGFGASSVRAAIMVSLSLFLRASGERYDGISAWSISALVITALSPAELFCAGFQLSFAVVFGMLVLSPRLTKILSFTGKRFSSALGSVLSAQISAVPICLYSFGSLSPAGVVLNLVMIPIVGVVYGVLIFTTILGGIFGISYITLFLVKYVVTAIIFVITSLDGLLWMIGGFTFGAFAVCYYAAEIAMGNILNLKNRIRTILCIALSLTVCLGTIVKTTNEAKPHFYLSGNDDICFSVFSAKKEKVLVISEFENNFSVSALNKITGKEKFAEFDAVIVEKRRTSDEIMRLVTRLLTVANIKTIVAFEVDSAETIELELLINKSFPKIKLCLFGDGVCYKGDEYVYEYSCNGAALIATQKEGAKILIAANTGDSESFESIKTERFYYAVSADKTGQTFSRIGSQKYVSYMYNGVTSDAQTYGYLKFYV